MSVRIIGKYLGFVLVSVLLACSSSEKESIYHGSIDVGIDESIFKVIQAQTDAYSHKYRGASFNNHIVPENVAVQLLLNDSLDVICITRLLNEEEQKVVDERGIKYRPAPMAHDGVILIVHPDMEMEGITFERLRALATGDDTSLKLVFDTGNSSNLNMVLEKLNIDEFDKTNVIAAGSNEKVFERIQKDKNAIGFVGYNLISETKSAKSNELRESVKMLAVDAGEGLIDPERETLVDKTYPFSRIIYLHTLGNAWTVENGFIRYACSHPGQLIANKMGLVSYYFFPNEFYMTKDPID